MVVTTIISASGDDERAEGHEQKNGVQEQIMMCYFNTVRRVYVSNEVRISIMVCKSITGKDQSDPRELGDEGGVDLRSCRIRRSCHKLNVLGAYAEDIRTGQTSFVAQRAEDGRRVVE